MEHLNRQVGGKMSFLLNARLTTGEQYAATQLIAFIAAMVSFILTTSDVYAQQIEQRYDFRIEAETLGEAMSAIIEQAGVSVLYPFELAQESGMNSVNGRYTVGEAIEILFKDTAFTGGLTQSGVIVITQGQSAVAQNGEATVETKKLKRSLLASLSALLFGVDGATAQEQVTSDDQNEAYVEVDESSAEEIETIVVTGSRIRRDTTFTSIAPLQTIDAETIRAAGFTSPVDIVTSQSVVTGRQPDAITANFQNTESGVGASSVSLRGLGAERTLVLINGRRLAPAGIGGAPTVVDLNLVPSAVIGRVETLLDGAGSVYGSDAVAGVVNIILQDDFEGMKLELSGGNPTEGAGEDYLISFVAGDHWDKGHFQFAAEYREQRPVRFEDRDYMRADSGFFCPYDVERNSQTGEVFRHCFGQGNGYTLFGGPPASPFGDGPEVLNAVTGEQTGFFEISDTTVSDYRSYTKRQGSEIINSLEVLSFFANGEHELSIGDWTTNLFVEGSWANRRTARRDTYHFQIFPTIPADNPTNPFGVPKIALLGNMIPTQNVDTDLSQARTMAGFRGKLGFLPSWDYEVFGGYTRSNGQLTRPILRSDNLAVSLNTTVDDGSGNLSCGQNPTDLFGFLPDPCVVVDLFAPSLYDPLNPQLATQEEYDFLFGQTVTRSINEQLLIGGFFSGPVMELPAGEVYGVLGLEYRDDSVDTTNFSDGGLNAPATRGSVHLTELYGEIVVPLLSDRPLVHSLDLEAAGRFISHEFFGEDFVYSLKGRWRPVEWLSFRGTYGTSFRAPNLGELFLGESTNQLDGQQDPCVVPLAAQVSGTYDPSLDTRNPQVLANCAADGVDPTTLGLDQGSFFEEVTTGNQNLDPETSTAFTVGTVIDLPLTDRFDLQLGVNYFEVEVEDSVNSPGGLFILNECYSSQNFASEPFCAAVDRNPGGFINTVDATPFNTGFFNSIGIDYNIAASFDFTAFGRPWGASFSSTITRQLEREEQSLPGSPVIDDVGDYGTPKWRAIADATLSTGPWSAFYRLQYVGTQDNIDEQFLVPGIDGVRPDGTLTSSLGADTVVTKVGSYYHHTISFQYRKDSFSARFGIRNLTDERPPEVDHDVDILAFLYGFPVGVGYDVNGRTAFVNLVKEF